MFVKASGIGQELFTLPLILVFKVFSILARILDSLRNFSHISFIILKIDQNYCEKSAHSPDGYSSIFMLNKNNYIKKATHTTSRMDISVEGQILRLRKVLKLF